MIFLTDGVRKAGAGCGEGFESVTFKQLGASNIPRIWDYERVVPGVELLKDRAFFGLGAHLESLLPGPEGDRG